MATLKIKSNADVIGATVSFLCLLHCMATPLIFLTLALPLERGAQVHSSWWEFLDYPFLSISLIAVFYSGRTTSKKWIQKALWICWGVLVFVLLNEKYSWIYIAEVLNYLPALALIGLHLYNRKYCQCEEDQCCVKEDYKA